MHEQNAKTTSEVTEVELIFKNKTKAADRQKITSSKDAYDILMKSWDENKIDLVEHFKLLLLDRSNACLAVTTLSTGGITGCLVDVRGAFATALKARATGIIMAHNHPSGNLTMSPEDVSLTKRFSQAGQVLNIKIFDHIIVTSDGYKSFADEGLMP